MRRQSLGAISRSICLPEYLTHWLTSLPAEKDVASSIVPEYAQSWDPAVEKRLVRKIDMILMPFMWIGYGLVYYDKVSQTLYVAVTC